MTIKEEILKDLEDYYTKEYKIAYLKNVLNNGCVSGIVSNLIYYKDTNDFYNDFQEEIEELIYNSAEENGEPYLKFIASLNGADSVGSMEQLKNLLSWFAYEEIARRVLIEDFKEDY